MYFREFTYEFWNNYEFYKENMKFIEFNWFHYV